MITNAELNSKFDAMYQGSTRFEEIITMDVWADGTNASNHGKITSSRFRGYFHNSLTIS